MAEGCEIGEVEDSGEGIVEAATGGAVIQPDARRARSTAEVTARNCPGRLVQFQLWNADARQSRKPIPVRQGQRQQGKARNPPDTGRSQTRALATRRSASHLPRLPEPDVRVVPLLCCRFRPDRTRSASHCGRAGVAGRSARDDHSIAGVFWRVTRQSTEARSRNCPVSCCLVCAERLAARQETRNTTLAGAVSPI